MLNKSKELINSLSNQEIINLTISAFSHDCSTIVKDFLEKKIFDILGEEGAVGFFNNMEEIEVDENTINFFKKL